MRDIPGEVQALEKVLASYPVHLRATETYVYLQSSYMDLRNRLHKALYATRSRKNPYTVMYKRNTENGAQLPYLKCPVCACDDIKPDAAGRFPNEEDSKLVIINAFSCLSCGSTFAIFFSWYQGQAGTVAWMELISKGSEEPYDPHETDGGYTPPE